MDAKQEKLILESLFIILSALDPRRLNSLNPISDITDQKSEINNRLWEIQKEEEGEKR